MASGPTLARSLANSTLAMPPVNQLNSLEHLQNLPHHKGLARAGQLFSLLVVAISGAVIASKGDY